MLKSDVSVDTRADGDVRVMTISTRFEKRVEENYGCTLYQDYINLTLSH